MGFVAFSAWEAVFFISRGKNGELTSVPLPALFTPLDSTPSKATRSLSEVRLHYVESPAQGGAMTFTFKGNQCYRWRPRPLGKMAQLEVCYMRGDYGGERGFQIYILEVDVKDENSYTHGTLSKSCHATIPMARYNAKRFSELLAALSPLVPDLVATFERNHEECARALAEF